jgi:hypothetical protein
MCFVKRKKIGIKLLAEDDCELTVTLVIDLANKAPEASSTQYYARVGELRRQWTAVRKNACV